MVRALSVLGLILLSIASGIAATSIPIDGRTLSEHIRSRYEAPPRTPGKPTAKAPAAAARPAGKPTEPKVATAKPAPSKPVVREGQPTKKDRAELDELIGEKLGG